MISRSQKQKCRRSTTAKNKNVDDLPRAEEASQHPRGNLAMRAVDMQPLRATRPTLTQWSPSVRQTVAKGDLRRSTTQRSCCRQCAGLVSTSDVMFFKKGGARDGITISPIGVGTQATVMVWSMNHWCVASGSARTCPVHNPLGPPINQQRSQVRSLTGYEWGMLSGSPIDFGLCASDERDWEPIGANNQNVLPPAQHARCRRM